MAYIVTNDPKRLTQLSLTGITEKSLELIHRHKDILMPLVEPIVDQLYDEIYKVDHLRNTIDETSSLERLKVTQKRYLRSSFSPIINENYIEERYRIGIIHSKIGLELPWFISTYRRYCQIISNYISNQLPEGTALPLVNAIESLLNFDTQITVDAYNELEIDKAAYPLRYEFKHLQQKSGLTKKDFEFLDEFCGLFTFHLEEILTLYKQELMKRSSYTRENHSFIEGYISYLQKFLKQFFQDKIYLDEASYYRIIRDWVRKLIKQKISEHILVTLIDSLNETTRGFFCTKKETAETPITDWLNAFERFTRFSLAVTQELLHPYQYINIYHFLDIFSYEISVVDFGRITWLDHNAENLLTARGFKKEEIIGKRCYELFYDRVLPCNQCPARNRQNNASITAYSQNGIPSYYKTWRLPQSRLSEITHRLLVSQDISRETKVTFDTVESLLHLAEYRDDDTGEHVDRIGLFAGKLAEIAGCDEKFIKEIQIAAKFHDIGKVGIPDSILNKPGKLSKEEWESMKTHVNIGHQILTNLDFPVIQTAARIAETHHEHWDGSGYPNQLKGEEIPLEGRIVAIVDVFDALMSKRAYKKPYPPETVKEIIKKEKGKHFDPHLTELFLSTWDEFIELYNECSEGKIHHYV